jgi:glycosyltransferase involved in cell wall biosynthesis
MKNILLTTTIYPLKSNNKGTPVCHYFAKEWVEMGYNVKVFHVQNVYPFYFYWIAKLLAKYIISKTGAVVYTSKDRGDEFVLDNVQVYRIPVFKQKPHGKNSNKSINRFMAKILEVNKNENFIPDIILGHFPNPQLEIVSRLKDYYQEAITSIIMHGNIPAIINNYRNNYKKLFQNIDIWGYRSKSIQNRFEKEYGLMSKFFICYSGIPEKYTQNIERDFSHGIKSFSFLGGLIKLKRVEDTLYALKSVSDDKEFSFDITGDGAEKNNLMSLTKSLNIKNNVTFHGQIDRDKAQDILEKTDCFIMVSSREAFGLVYIEAMAKGCITIGTRGQGIDGVIKHGKNGFLCEAENIEELTNIINKIRNLPIEELKRISDNAIETAKNMTDKKMAEHYINSVINAKI